jgi:uncharacterized protein YbbC (DUF1343 family)
VAFEPTANKWKGEICRGFQIHVTDHESYRPYQTSLKLLQAVLLIHKDKFEWKSPPYEYEFKKRPIDLILGDKSIRQSLESGMELDELEKGMGRKPGKVFNHKTKRIAVFLTLRLNAGN